MAPPPHLMPELIVDEILVCFPPDDPGFLVRASVVCKPWHRLLCNAAFRRRYAAFHQASPPLLGFLHNCSINDHGKYYTAPRFVCTTTPSPMLPLQPFDDCNYGWRILDCRHGRVLFKPPNPVRRARALFNAPEVNVSSNLAVWDRATGEHELVPKSRSAGGPCSAVICGVRGCDHLDCDGGPFLVVSVGCKPLASDVRSRVYSSEANTWSSSSFLGPAAGYVTVCKPSVLIGDDIYFVLATRPVIAMAILKIDLDRNRNRNAIINPPEGHNFNDGNFVLMATEDGSLGITAILGSTLRLWSRNVMNSEVLAGWGPCRVIELQTLIPFRKRLRVVGSAEGSGIIFVASDFGVFSLDLKAGRERKVDEPIEDIIIFPFMGFYTPDGSSKKLRLRMGPPDESLLIYAK